MFKLICICITTGPNSGPSSFNYEEEPNFRGVPTSSDMRESSGGRDGGGGGERNCAVCNHCANSSGGESPHKGPSADTDDSGDEKPTFCESNCSCQSQSRVSRDPTPEPRNNGIMVKNDKPVLKFSVSAILGGADREGDKSRLDDDHMHFNPGKGKVFRFCSLRIL